MDYRGENNKEITGASGSLLELFPNYLDDIPGKNYNVEIKKAAIHKAAHILVKILIYHSFYLEDNFQNFCIMTLRDKASP
jgi:hypothetical protein